MKEKAFRELHMELCWNIVKGGKKMDYINAFWVGGLICALAQILLDRKSHGKPGGTWLHSWFCTDI